MRPIHSELAPLHDERRGRAAALVHVRTEVLEKGFDLLPVESAIEAPNLVERHIVAGHGTMLWYSRSMVNVSMPPARPTSPQVMDPDITGAAYLVELRLLYSEGSVSFIKRRDVWFDRGGAIVAVRGDGVTIPTLGL